MINELISTYIPTPEDRARIMPKEGRLKVSGDGIFATRQGEGVTAGMNTIFIRLHFCNLACGRDRGWKCDTKYTWDNRSREFWQEPIDMKPEDVAKAAEESWSEAFGDASGHRVVVTGGEPLLQQKKLALLFSFLPNWAVEIETNGTIAPLPELSDCQFNCSPKLANSGNTVDRRYRPEALRNIALLPNSWFKFVVCREGDLDEIDQIVKDCNIPSNSVLIMPEGRDASLIAKQADSLKDQVSRRGWGITLRNQLVWFGDKRRT